MLAATGGLARRPHRISQNAGIRGTSLRRIKSTSTSPANAALPSTLEPSTEDAFAVSQLKFFLARLATVLLLISSNGQGQMVA
jgi:hypothetical protein